MLRILSLGAGVQSSTVLLMSCLGELPKLDAAIFADTQWEPKGVYDYLNLLETEAKKADIPVYRTTKGNLRDDMLASTIRGLEVDGKRAASMPLHILKPDGGKGMLRRQCSREYKIEPVEKFIRRELLGLARGEWAERNSVELWLGISTDEMRRMTQSDKRWKVHHYPLIFDAPMSRSGCLRWMADHGFALPGKSSCLACPYHSTAEWKKVRAVPSEWADAVEFDRQIRAKKDIHGVPFVHRDCVPLEDVDLDNKTNQLNLWSEECSGMCGV